MIERGLLSEKSSNRLVEKQYPERLRIKNTTFKKITFDHIRTITEYSSSGYDSSYTEPFVLEDSLGF